MASTTAPETTSATAANAGNRMLAALCAASFLAAVNFFATGPFYAEIARDLHTSVPLLGQIATLMIVISTGLGLVVGPLADRYGYRWLLTGGVLAVAVNLIGTGLAPSYPVLFVLGVVGGLADAIVFGLPLAIAGVRYGGAAQKRAISWTLAALASAPIVGTPLLTAAGGVAGWRAALVGAGVVAALAAGFVAFALPPDAKRPATRLAWAELRAAYVPLLRHGPSLRLLGYSALRAVGWIGLLAYLGAFLADRVGFTGGRAGLVYTASGLGLAAGNFLGGRIQLGNPRRALALLALVSAAAGAFAFTRTSPWAVVPLLLVVAFASALAGLTVAGLLVAESPAGLGTTMVFNGSVFNAGSAVGTALGGALIALGGYTALALGLPIFSVIGAILVWSPTPSRRAD